MNELIERLNEKCRSIRIKEEKEKLQDSYNELENSLELSCASIAVQRVEKMMLIDKHKDVDTRMNKSLSKMKEVERSRREALEISKESDRLMSVRCREALQDM